MAERQVVFYRCLDVDGKPPFDPLEAITPINDLDDHDWRIPDGASDIAVIVDKPGSATAPSRLRLLRIREDAPFLLSSARKLTPLQVAENEAITEFTWALLWPDGYLGAVSSRDAPAHKRLGRYFSDTSGQQTHIVNLFQPDILDKLKELCDNGLRRVNLKLASAHAGALEADNAVKGFSSILRANRESSAATIGIDLSVGRAGAAARLKRSIGQGTLQVATEYIDALESMHVRGYDSKGQLRELNMKQERIRWPINDHDGTANKVYKEIRLARKAVEEDIGGLQRAALGH